MILTASANGLVENFIQTKKCNVGMSPTQACNQGSPGTRWITSVWQSYFS